MITKKNLFVIINILLISTAIYAQSPNFERVPKQYSLEVGASYLLKSDMDGSLAMGYGGMFDYGWKFSGFHKKKPVYMTVPIGYIYYPAINSGEVAAKRMNYGWTVRHELARDKKFVPFLGYALLLNSLSFENIPGRVMGHETKFELGSTFYTKSRLSYFVKLEYSYMSFPALGIEKTPKVHEAEIKAGIRIN